ncbi:hypothetical protein [Burkholderia vietnamiensis]|uniref:hypothetical protein n=1 Tax=Burkholderia vietnamiensis TaxID=60552 RepID=UPI001BA243FE|nr:hypothetical protein [Burkholderia vietnamiensis]MBR8202096.1 hypothetical protein [Burkholderia vietnamiensis]
MTFDEEREEIGRAGNRLLSVLLRESERAVVVLGAAQIDADLERLLMHVLHPAASRNDDLLDTGQPLSAFAVKISLAHRLGIIDDDFKTALNTVRKIRNDFAHNAAEPGLALEKHRDRVEQVVKWAERDLTYQRGMSKSVFPDDMPMLRRQFIVSIISMMLLLRTGVFFLHKVDCGVQIRPAI